MTNDETRIELFQALAELGRLHPDWRLGQTLSNLAMAAGGLDAAAVWDLEDEEALVAARRVLQRRTAEAAGNAFSETPQRRADTGACQDKS